MRPEWKQEMDALKGRQVCKEHARCLLGLNCDVQRLDLHVVVLQYRRVHLELLIHVVVVGEIVVGWQLRESKRPKCLVNWNAHCDLSVAVIRSCL